jgi:flagellar basal body-associated protein FliL
MGKGFTSYNVWPQSSASGASRESKELQIKENVNEIKTEKEELVDVISDKLSKILLPLIEAIKLQTKPLKQEEEDFTNLKSNQKENDLKTQLDKSKKTERILLICIIILGVLTILSFLAALWSANSVEKLLRILYKLKQSKP